MKVPRASLSPASFNKGSEFKFTVSKGHATCTSTNILYHLFTRRTLKRSTSTRGNDYHVAVAETVVLSQAWLVSERFDLLLPLHLVAKRGYVIFNEEDAAFSL